MEKYDDYLRITGRKTYIFIAALTLVLVSVIIWGLTGTVPVVETFDGVIAGPDQQIVEEEFSETEYSAVFFCDASRFRGKTLVGKSATITLADGRTVKGEVVSCSDVPFSRKEADQYVTNDWVAAKLIEDEYVYMLFVCADEDLSEDILTVVKISVTTDEVSPITFLMR